MNIHEELELQDCPYCGGAGLLEEENGWCWYVMCLDCGAQTAINLDGGGSTKLYFYNQVLNKPTSPSRQVSDALIFR